MADRQTGAPPLRPLARPADLDSGGTPVGTSPAETAAARPRTRPEGIGQTSDETAEAATLSGALPLDQLSLIGLFHGPDGGQALLRLTDGEIVRVGTGAAVAGGRVTAISRDAVRLRHGARELILRMPV